jgi:CRISPR-associated protein Cmr2
VQDFIATARKSRDLWYGSWLLSELSKAIAKHIADNHGKLIFPHPLNKDDSLNKDDLNPNTDFNVPNRIVAELDQFTVNDGEAVKNALFTRLRDLWQEALKQVKGPIDTIDLAKKQVMDLPEFYWVVVPFEGDHDYSMARNKAEALLASRKNTRDFEQMVGSYKPKSSLDGIRESVIPESVYPEKGDTESSRDLKIRDLFHLYHANQAERLSGVDLLKRLGRGAYEPKFPSTSDLAASPYFAHLNDDKQKSKQEKIIREILDFLKDKDVDERDVSETTALVYESRLFEFLPDESDQQAAHEMLEDLLDTHFGKLRPTPYYALLIADGDNMGRLIDTKSSAEEHRKLSASISHFAKNVPKMIQDNFGGTCIYAGGEDILAYLPLHTTLDCAKALEDKFRQDMSPFIFQDADGNELQPTLSGGIVIAHHLTPLSDVFSSARMAEKEAKLVEGKNALSIVLNKRSGTERLIKDKWPKLNNRLIILVTYLKNNWISSGAAYELQNLYLDLTDSEVPPAAIAEEAFRIISRKQQSGSQIEIPGHVRDQFNQWLLIEKIPISEIALEMIIAREFTASENMAKYIREEVKK